MTNYDEKAIKFFKMTLLLMIITIISTNFYEVTQEKYFLISTIISFSFSLFYILSLYFRKNIKIIATIAISSFLIDTVLSTMTSLYEKNNLLQISSDICQWIFCIFTLIWVYQNREKNKKN